MHSDLIDRLFSQYLPLSDVICDNLSNFVRTSKDHLAANGRLAVPVGGLSDDIIKSRYTVCWFVYCQVRK